MLTQYQHTYFKQLLIKKIMKNLNILWLLFVLISNQILAQKTMSITGKITDLENSKTIENATVILVGNGNVYQIISDKNGRFEFKNLQKGTYNIYTSLESYLSNEKAGIILTTKSLDVSIGLNKINRIVQKTYSYVPRPIRYYNSYYLSPFAQAPNQNINAIAAYSRGVDSRNGETPSIKGARPENTAYYIDGVRVNYFTGEVIIGKQ